MLSQSDRVNYNFLRVLTIFGSTTIFSVASLTANASTLINSTDYLEYELPKSVQQQCFEKNNCPEIEVKYIKTNHKWINTLVNARINNLVINSQPSESPVNKATSTTAAKLAIDNFAKSQFSELPNDSVFIYSLMVTPEYLGHMELGHVELGHVKRGHVKRGQAEDFELFEINTYVFTGGAHGMPFSEYLVFDSSSKKQVILTDMLEVGKKPRFKALAYEAYKTWVKTVDKDVSGYEKNWPFILSDNVTLTDKGINIRYQHYAIGPYAYGMPVLSIPYTKLDGIIKPRFLPNNKSVKN